MLGGCFKDLWNVMRFCTCVSNDDMMKRTPEQTGHGFPFFRTFAFSSTLNSKVNDN